MKYIQELKQSQLSEHAKSLKDIEEERIKLQEEKARNDIAKTLNSRNADDSGRFRVEIEAAVKYAEVNNFCSSFNLICVCVCVIFITFCCIYINVI